LFEASVVCGALAAGRRAEGAGAWREFGADFGSLFQVVDDILDGDGFAAELGVDGARALASETARATRARLPELADADTSVLDELVGEVVARVA